LQYLYHPRFAAQRQKKKFEKTVRFGRRLPLLRLKSSADVTKNGLTRERVLAVVVRLINHLYFRVGTEESVRRYRTYGITTLRNRHVVVEAGRLTFNFVGKHHIKHLRLLVDPELASLVRKIQNLRGSRLFQYVDEEGRARPVTSRDVNTYIKQAMGPEFSAKDLRIWGGTLLAAVGLLRIGPAASETQAKRNIVSVMKRVAESLGNTAAICRSS